MENRKYFDDCMCGLADVMDGDKPLLIVSEGKSTLAYETIAMMAERSNLSIVLKMMRCEDGNLHEHVLVSSREFGGKNDYALAASRLIDKNIAGEINRGELQFYLGRMLGYPMADVLEFIGSATARNCPCDCCGGPFVPVEMFDEGVYPNVIGEVNIGNGPDTW
jgi:hypothetical protein